MHNRTRHAVIARSWPVPLLMGVAIVWSGLMPARAHEDHDDVEALLKRIQALEARLERLEQQDGTPLAEQPIAPSAETGAAETEVADESGPVAGPAEGFESLGEAVSGSEREAPRSAAAEPEPSVDIGGALRFNLVHRDFADSSQTKYGESGLDVFRLNVDGQLGNILVSAEYRFYSFMDTIHHGWIGYEFEDKSQLQFGIHRVPFGLLPYAAHNAWFGVPYYVGLADDYDMGVKYVREDGPWSTQLAFYKNEELNDAGNLDRYSFDLVQAGEQQNEEVNQFNARVAYTFGADTGCEVELGASAQASEVYNALSDRSGDHWAAAAHMDSRCGRWNLQLQGARYDYAPSNPVGVLEDRVRVGAFGASYDIAGEADILVANLAYNFDSPWPQIDQITCYNDYSRLFKDIDGASDSQINTLGCAIGSGPLFTYVDWILANNMAFFGNGSMAGGGEDEWRSRINVNVGFYW